MDSAIGLCLVVLGGLLGCNWYRSRFSASSKCTGKKHPRYVLIIDRNGTVSEQEIERLREKYKVEKMELYKERDFVTDHNGFIEQIRRFVGDVDLENKISSVDLENKISDGLGGDGLGEKEKKEEKDKDKEGMDSDKGDFAEKIVEYDQIEAFIAANPLLFPDLVLLCSGVSTYRVSAPYLLYKAEMWQSRWGFSERTLGWALWHYKRCSIRNGR
ncbi:hypothetical protein NEHOM01_2142 [Nematocida homosporus]|uniref:uncharacterized protein n=1 Tax=Nematocida homosporus TaxID=1912981 RepID=UPI0022200F45|nr:uncharacterized protein NEHOM01_2142 [Nematocida homosporus]KAI5187392.1 hypothetical protein NEHOM01_2142 [Nematocida homosporus]